MKISNELNLKDSTWRADQGGIAKPGFKQALLQASSSSAQLAPAASVSATQQYTVRAGDTMFAIARRALEAGDAAHRRGEVRLRVRHISAQL